MGSKPGSKDLCVYSGIHVSGVCDGCVADINVRPTATFLSHSQTVIDSQIDTHVEF